MTRSSQFHHGNSSDFTLVPSLLYIVTLSDLSGQGIYGPRRAESTSAGKNP